MQYKQAFAAAGKVLLHYIAAFAITGIVVFMTNQPKLVFLMPFVNMAQVWVIKALNQADPAHPVDPSSQVNS